MNAEFATDNGGFFGVTPPLLQVPFVVGSGPQAITPADEQYFSGLDLTSQ
jgi:hypothetical protein